MSPARNEGSAGRLASSMLECRGLMGERQCACEQVWSLKLMNNALLNFGCADPTNIFIIFIRATMYLRVAKGAGEMAHNRLY